MILIFIIIIIFIIINNIIIIIIIKIIIIIFILKPLNYLFHLVRKSKYIFNKNILYFMIIINNYKILKKYFYKYNNKF